MAREKKTTIVIDKKLLRDFAAEIKRLTNFPLSEGIVEEAIKAVKFKKEA